MKVKLPESARERKRSYGGATVSTLLHAVLLGGGVVATGATVEVTSAPPPLENLVYVVPERPEPPPPEPARERPPVEIPTNIEPVPAADAPPPNLALIPDVLPPVHSTIGTMRVDDFKATPRDTMPPGAGSAIDPDAPFTELTVERAVQPRSGNPLPRYPGLLQASGIEGAAFMQFVVDTAGRVEPGSITVVRSDHVLFERAVRDALLRARYVPAEAGGRRVRQMVEQAFAFALRR